MTGAATWRKSSYSGPNGGDCVECAVTRNAAWHKSSHSGNTGGDCLEVAAGCRAAVPVRDSKNPGGPVLVLSADAWQAFVDGFR
uniref:DUF397 domain-containing protein n=1 Tax=Streptomyces halstedii TaxID=1944 RepID=UPI0035567442